MYTKTNLSLGWFEFHDYTGFGRNDYIWCYLANGFLQLVYIHNVYIPTKVILLHLTSNIYAELVILHSNLSMIIWIITCTSFLKSQCIMQLCFENQCGMARKRNIHGVFLLWINVLEEHTSLKSIAFPCNGALMCWWRCTPCNCLFRGDNCWREVGHLFGGTICFCIILQYRLKLTIATTLLLLVPALHQKLTDMYHNL